jgi:predicted DNA-binding transcriptional regulator AlpA
MKTNQTPSHEEATLFLTRAELARHLRISERQLDTVRSDASFPAPVTVGRSPRWLRISIIKWAEQQNEHAESET